MPKVCTLQTDKAIITAISAVPASDQAFLTASKTGEVSVWQVNSGRPAAVLQPSEDGEQSANASVITSLEVLANHLVLAGTYGQGISVWDLRSDSDPLLRNIMAPSIADSIWEKGTWQGIVAC